MAGLPHSSNRYVRSNYRKTGGHIDYGYIGIAHGKITISLDAAGQYYTAITASYGNGGVGEVVSIGFLIVNILAGGASDGTLGITQVGGGHSAGVSTPYAGSAALEGVVLVPWVSGASGGAAPDYPTIWGIDAFDLSGAGDTGSKLKVADNQGTLILQYALFIVSR